jgi:hypothetical protein
MAVVVWVLHPDWFVGGALVKKHIGKIADSWSYWNTFACRHAAIETTSNVLAHLTFLVLINSPRLLLDPRGLGSRSI